MRGYIYLLLVALANAKPGYDYPKPPIAFTLPPTTTEAPTTTVFVCTPGSLDLRCEPDCFPGSEDPRCPSLEYLPPVEPIVVEVPTTTAPPPPTTTAFVCTPGSLDPRCPPDCYLGSPDPRCPPPPPPTTTAPPPPPTTTAFVCTPGSLDPRCPPDCYLGSPDPRCPPPPPPVEYLPPTDTGTGPSNENVVLIRTSTTAAPTRPPTRPTNPPTTTMMVKTMEEHLLWDYKESIPGLPEVDYPILERIPETSFTCEGRLAGYYADIETRCQVFHICGDNFKNSFLCPNGTLFNQENFACQWWADIDCPSSDQFFSLNAKIGVVPDKATVKRQTGVPLVSANVPASQPMAPSHFSLSAKSLRQLRSKRRHA